MPRLPNQSATLRKSLRLRKPSHPLRQRESTIYKRSSKAIVNHGINMTTKGLSRKQVIVLINGDNKKNFMEESSSYVTNMNSILKNIKLDVMIDFV